MKLWIKIVLILVLMGLSIAAWLRFPAAWEALQSKKRSAELEVQKEELRNVLSFYQVFSATPTPKGWSAVSSDGSRMFTTTLENKRVWVNCSQPVNLKEEGIIKYATQAPLGELAYINDQWYIAKVSLPFAGKEEVVKHTSSCIQELQLKIENKKNAEQENMKSWQPSTLH